MLIIMIVDALSIWVSQSNNFESCFLIKIRFKYFIYTWMKKRDKTRLGLADKSTT